MIKEFFKYGSVKLTDIRVKVAQSTEDRKVYWFTPNHTMMLMPPEGVTFSDKNILTRATALKAIHSNETRTERICPKCNKKFRARGKRVECFTCSPLKESNQRMRMEPNKRGGSINDSLRKVLATIVL